MAIESLISVLSQHLPSVLFITFVGYVASNYFNRGLNKYPGKFIASLTDWWRFWIVYKKRPEVEHINLHAKYGDVVRLGPNNLSFADPKALKTIYGLSKGFTKVSTPFMYQNQADNLKSEFYPVQQSVAGGHRLPSLFSTTSEPFHQQLRRCVNSAFSMSTLIQYEPFVDSTTELFLEQTEKLFAKTAESCDFSRWLQFYAFDVIGEMTYGKRHGFLEQNEDIEGIIDYISKLFNYVAPVRINLLSSRSLTNNTFSPGWSNTNTRHLLPQEPAISSTIQMGHHRRHIPCRTLRSEPHGRTVPQI